MTVDYKFYIRHNGRNGTKKAHSITNMTSFRYRKTLFGGSLSLNVNELNRIVGNVENYDQFEVYWENSVIGVPRTRDFVGIFREPTVATDSSGITNHTLTCPRDADILSYRHIAYESGKDGFSSFSAIPAETIGKTIVAQNMTAIATVANGRVRDGDLGNPLGMNMAITIAADLGRGNLITRNFEQGNVYGVLDRLKDDGGGYFTLTKTGGSTWEFDFRLDTDDDKSTGVDRVLFSLKRGNLLEPTLTVSRIGSATVAIAAGRGKKDEREFVPVLGPDYAPDNDIEMFVNASNQSGAGLVSVAESKLEEKREKRLFDFNVVQTSNTFYSPVPVNGKRTYDVGTVVAVNYNDVIIPRLITAVDVSGSGGDNPTYQFKIETKDL